jgi:hypothetical protein
VRRLIAILFLLLFTSTTEAGEIYKLPVLVNHWRLHQEEGRSTRFYQFFKEHYLIDHHDKDKQQDDQLPFKGMHVDHFSLLYTSEPLPPLKDLLLHSAAPDSSYIPPYTPYTHLLGIFHPPRSHPVPVA